MMPHHVYILSNPLRTTLYINSTDDLSRTIAGHKKGKESLFTRKYKLVHMIYLETFANEELADARKRQLKNWRRDWKWNLILAANPKLRELVQIDAEPSSASKTSAHKKSLTI
ncbi:MAG: GIY-YIG nuclease family protein [Flavobacterium sp.]|nr:MAG: GIY-YIG nuclease family protein [Flavobacterium sp.]